MSDTAFNPRATAAWANLIELADSEKNSAISDHFAANPARATDYSIRLEGLYLDYSKNRISDAVKAALLALLEQSPVQQLARAMADGEVINLTEQRAVLHMALRGDHQQPFMIDDIDITTGIRAELKKVAAFSEQVRSGQWTGETGKAITDVINIGIGGSDLGPKMVCHALQEFASDALRMHFIANVDGAEINTTLASLNPETTLVIISSKTFTTQETLMNAQTALRWFSERGGMDNAQQTRHFVGVTASRENALAFGIAENQIFEFWDWVGGRYSLWSTIGLSIAICVGMENFSALLAGARAMDQHFLETEPAQNMPIMLALIGVWYSNFLGAQSHAVSPYCERMGLLPAYLQQLDMESNGKSVSRNGEPVEYSTGPILWGQTGTNGQHAFFQLLHQGTHLVPMDLIAAVKDKLSNDEQHQALLGNMVAQSAALMSGFRDENLPAYRQYEGNRPSNVLLMDELTPYNLGALIALYEHKVFVQGMLWNINSFDQWGVELGKKMANSLLGDEPGKLEQFDESTQTLMKIITGD